MVGGQVGKALITGAASGIGLATARLLRADGWDICGLDLRDVPAELAGSEWIVCDLSDPASLEQALGQLEGRGFDAMILSAGIAGLGAAQRVLRINFIAARRMLMRMFASISDGGSVTLVSSGAGWRWQERLALLDTIIAEPDDEVALALASAHCEDAAAAYNLSKELLCAMAARECLREWSRAVRLNSVSPGGVETPLIKDFVLSMGQDAMDFSARLVGRHARADEVAEVIGFLCEPRAGWVNGADIKVDGGLVGALSAGAAGFAGWQ